MERFTCTWLLAVTVTWTLVADVRALNPSVDAVLSPPSNTIYIGEKTVVNNTVLIPDSRYDNVVVVLYPTLDEPDFAITKIRRVRLGRNLVISGSLEPLLDFKKTPSKTGKSFACQFDLGTVKRVGTPRSDEDVTFFVQYEAVVPDPRMADTGPGHDHTFGLSIKAGEDSYTIGYKTATFRTRSLPLLFREKEKEILREDELVREMIIQTQEKKLWKMKQ